MIPALAQLQQVVPLQALLPLVLVYARVQACVLMLPGVGEQAVPVRVRVAVAMALTPMLSGVAQVPDAAAATQVTIAVLVAAEVATGLALGIMAVSYTHLRAHET